jgi:hypothetical protein
MENVSNEKRMKETACGTATAARLSLDVKEKAVRPRAAVNGGSPSGRGPLWGGDLDGEHGRVKWPAEGKAN